MKTYSEMLTYPTFEARFEYLKLSGAVGEMTFGGKRAMNQRFYRSPRWKSVRNYIIVRDDANDLASIDHPIGSTIIVHHINPITDDDILYDRDVLYDPENLVSVSYETHNAIHYGGFVSDPYALVERTPNDTAPWLK